MPDRAQTVRLPRAKPRVLGREGCNKCLGFSGVVGVGIHRCVDGARQNGIHTNSLRTIFCGESFCQSNEAGLARCVRRDARKAYGVTDKRAGKYDQALSSFNIAGI